MSKRRPVSPESIASRLVEPEDRPGRYGPTVVYRFYDAGLVLLYVGVTGRPDERWTVHKARSVWWPQVAHLETDLFPSMHLALIEERRIIRDEHPTYNKRSRVH